MPARDIYHDPVCNALRKDGWLITNDPLTIEYEDVHVFADLGAQRLLAAEREQQRIVVEIKSFLGRSPMRELETAIGQYIVYRTFLKQRSIPCPVYIAISSRIYESFFRQRSIRTVTEENAIFLIVVDVKQEVILQWIQ
jgi:hypothetical protein